MRVKSSKATIYDIAQKASVSTTTVHKVLHNRPGVGAEKRAEILSLAQDMNYVRNIAAQSLSRKEIHIGIVAEVFNREFGKYIFQGIQSELKKLGNYKVIGHFSTLENALNRTRVLDDFSHALNSNMDGVIIFPTSPYYEYAEFNELIEKSNIPVVVIQNEVPHLKTLCSIEQDGDALGGMAGDLMNLVNPGGRSVVFIGSKNVYAQNASINHFAKAVAKTGGEVFASFETQVENRIGYILAENLAKNYPGVTGIFVGVSQSLGVIERLQQLGCLEQYKIITVDTYSDVFQRLRNGEIVATLDRHPFDMGKMAVRVLYQYLADGIVPPKRVRIPPSIILPSYLTTQQSSGDTLYFNV